MVGMAGKATPAIALLERQGVSFTLHEYPHDPRAASYGEEAADALGLEADRVFKTLLDRYHDTSMIFVVVAKDHIASAHVNRFTPRRRP